MRTTRNAPDHLATIGEELGELAADALADVRDRVEVGGGVVAEGARRLAEVAADALTDARHELAARIEPEQPSRKWRWFLAGGVAAAVAVALWAVLSRRPQQVDEPIRAVPGSPAAGGEGASTAAPDAPTPSAATRNGHTSG
ncbi:MAG: hypothetical protein J0I34_13670 [Pseudonocardia sp.]|uniref:hypothetical protein n=1 Tax=unclassified Pseudonocardia TaxID=2619320 RepID=UPI00086CD3DD|nr:MULTISPECIES: hypothetical protein [unclassified Pseudonocardia]MBN9109819.1 hypothetical protein [Pseudonocardia sp.]ODU23249.1 MAG: hypothetical protein ABS80_15495 [Pseudonocardia sp. SCN 72-51]ODV09218.1 MAG: hypothetical protein ABT15_01030 [Pseudonocardia sp. SCN 73-27]